MDTTVLNLRNLLEQLVLRVEVLSEGHALWRTDPADSCSRATPLPAFNQARSKNQLWLFWAEATHPGAMLGTKCCRLLVNLVPFYQTSALTRLRIAGLGFFFGEEFHIEEERKEVLQEPTACGWTPGPGKRTPSIAPQENRDESTVAQPAVPVPNDGGPTEAGPLLQLCHIGQGAQGKQVLDNLGKVTPPWAVDPRSQERRVTAQARHRGTEGCAFKPLSLRRPLTLNPVFRVGSRWDLASSLWKVAGRHVVSHPGCRDRCPLPCIPTLTGTPVRSGEAMLADFLSQASPMTPSVAVHCVNEQRGLTEPGLCLRGTMAGDNLGQVSRILYESELSS